MRPNIRHNPVFEVISNRTGSFSICWHQFPKYQVSGKMVLSKKQLTIIAVAL